MIKFLFYLVEIAITLFSVIFIFFKWKFSYWKRRNIAQLEPKFPYGHLSSPTGHETISIHLKSFYFEIRQRDLKGAGIYFFASPVYYMADLEMVKCVLTKDFQHFTDRGTYYNEKDDPLSAHLFAIEGLKWRNLRMKLTPTFTSGKMKMMFQTLLECETSLHKLAEECCGKGDAVDIKELTTRFSTDIIGSVAFGLDCHSFEDKNSPFRYYGKKIFESTPWQRLVITFSISFPELGRKLGLKITPTDCSDFFRKVVEDTVSYREKNGVVRNDFLQLLIDLKNTKLSPEEAAKHDGKSLTMLELEAQSFLFFAAGFETSSTTMTFTMYELARHPEIQERVRKEILAVLSKHNNVLTYDSLSEMKYLQQVIDEALRMYPPLGFSTRECVKEYQFPGSDIILEPGTKVIIPIYGIHHDPEFYENPEEYDPERFSEENKKMRHPYAHLPFGEGPRNCIGMRFGLMETKVGLVSLLRAYKFSVNSKTKEPLKMDVNSFVLAAEGSIWLNIEKL